MLRTLLADRFRLKIRREVKEGNVYALMVAKNGHKLKPAGLAITSNRSSFNQAGPPANR